MKARASIKREELEEVERERDRQTDSKCRLAIDRSIDLSAKSELEKVLDHFLSFTLSQIHLKPQWDYF